MKKIDPLLLRNNIHEIMEDYLGDDPEDWDTKYTPMLNEVMILLYKQLPDCIS